MKNVNVYIVCSMVQEEFMVFGTRKRAEEWIKNFNREIFDQSEESDLYVTSRLVF